MQTTRAEDPIVCIGGFDPELGWNRSQMMGDVQTLLLECQGLSTTVTKRLIDAPGSVLSLQERALTICLAWWRKQEQWKGKP